PLLSADDTDGRRFGAVLLLIAFMFLADLAALPAAAFGNGSITTSGFSDTESAVIATAVARFDHASLTLPRIHIRKAGGNGPCTRHGRTADTWPVVYITICEVAEPVIIHELAHAWTFDHLVGHD